MPAHCAVTVFPVNCNPLWNTLFEENSGIGFILFGSACDLALPLQQLCEVKMLLVNPLRRDYFPAMISVIEASEEESMFLQIKAKLENIV